MLEFKEKKDTVAEKTSIFDVSKQEEAQMIRIARGS